MATRIVKHTDLKVYQRARAAARLIFELTCKFPKEERYSLTDQIRRCSRSVCGNLAEAWRKRRYPNAFVSKLNDCEGEAAETQVCWNSPSMEIMSNAMPREKSIVSMTPSSACWWP